MTGLADIFGQDSALETIRRAAAADRLPHGLIFAGPQGVGKATTARALATLFLCQNPNGQEPCGTCHSCVLMGALNAANGTTNHPDYHVVFRQLIRLSKQESKARDLAVDVIRDHLLAPAALKPVMNRGKVFVVEQAELMNAAAQNSLLKTLEEPHGRTLIILLTDEPHALLPTIRSRSQIVRFAALDPGRVQQELEARGVARPAAAEAAKLAEGSLGLALRWIEDHVVEAAGELNQQIDTLIAGRPTGDLAGWFKRSAEAYAARQLERDPRASKDQATREGLSLYLRLAASRFRQQLSTTTDSEALESCCRAIDAIAQAEQYIDSNVNLTLALQQLASAFERAFVET